MIIKEAKFIVSAAEKKGFLCPDKPMIAVSGRSNVGKSSFINLLAGRKKLAKTSADPGRTRLVNYFDFGEFLLADLPGYGFARVSKAEKDRWARMLEDFFAEREHISHVFALVDIRHDPSADDLTMVDFLYASRIPFTVIATKSDKIARTKVKNYVRRIAACLKTGEGNILPVSSETGTGKEQVLSLLDEIVQRALDVQEEDSAEE